MCVHRNLGSQPRNYLAGYLKHSNLIMLVVEDEKEWSKCGSIQEMVKSRPDDWETRHKSKAAPSSTPAATKATTTSKSPNKAAKATTTTTTTATPSNNARDG